MPALADRGRNRVNLPICELISHCERIVSPEARVHLQGQARHLLRQGLQEDQGEQLVAALATLGPALEDRQLRYKLGRRSEETR